MVFQTVKALEISMAGRAFILLCCHDKGDFPKGHSAQLFAILTDAHGGCQHGVGYEVPWAASHRR